MTQSVQPVPNNDELKNLFAEKGELVTQLELGQFKLQQVNAKLNQILNIQQLQPQPIIR